MRLGELLQGLKVLRADGNHDHEIRGIAYDSGRVRDDYMFVAIKGLKADGDDFIKNSLG